MSFGFGLGFPRVRSASLEAAIAGLFPDVWYDPSDLTTLYQDAAGTTPVTAVEQPVGLMLDKSRGLVLGPELIPQPLNLTIGWAAAGGVSSRTASSFVTTSSGGITFGLASGKTYSIRLSGTTTGSLSVRNTNTLAGIYVISAGAFDVQITSPAMFASQATLYLAVSSAQTVTFTNISVRELPGNHAFQATSASRPVYSRRVNLLTKTEQFDDAVWVASRLNKTATKLTPTTENNYHNCAHSVTYTASGFVATIEAKADGYQFLQLLIISSGNYVEGVFNLSGAGTVENTSRNSTWTGTRSIELLSDGYYRCTVTVTTASAASGLFQTGVFPTNDSTATFAGDGTKGILARKASLVPADLAALPYQRVNTATDYDASDVFPAYLRCDGTDDGMVTNSIDFSATDKMFVSAGVRKLSDAALGIIAELSTTAASSNGAFVSFTLPTAGYGFNSRGTIEVGSNTTTGFAAPISNVLSGIGNISGDSAILRINGTQVASNTADQGTGNYGNYPLYLFRRGGSSLPFNGWFMGSVIAGKTLSASQISTVERYLAGKTKTEALA